MYHAPCCPSTPMFGWRPSGGHWILSRIIREGECCTLPAASTSDGRRYPKRALSERRSKGRDGRPSHSPFEERRDEIAVRQRAADERREQDAAGQQASLPPQPAVVQ